MLGSPLASAAIHDQLAKVAGGVHGLGRQESKEGYIWALYIGVQGLGCMKNVLGAVSLLESLLY